MLNREELETSIPVNSELQEEKQANMLLSKDIRY